MASLGDIGNFWATRSGSQYERWLGGCLFTAYQVKNEAPETANHVKRLAWADVILSAVDAVVREKIEQQMKYAIASNATLQADPTAIDDNGIKYIIASQLDILA